MKAFKKSYLRIKITDTITAESPDGLQLHLPAFTGRSRRRQYRPAWLSSIGSLNTMLVVRAVLTPSQVQDVSEAVERVRKVVSSLEAAQARTPGTTTSFAFDGGQFVATWTPPTNDGGGRFWTLVNPGKTIPGQAENKHVIGFYPSLFAAVWSAVERSLFATERTIEYTDLSRTVRETAERLTADLTVHSAQ